MYMGAERFVPGNDRVKVGIKSISLEYQAWRGIFKVPYLIGGKGNSGNVTSLPTI